ncbi:MAG: alternative ribosome rescue aminoacyl-tRNA hydrolase ArfB [Longimicrobiales bacterium]
MQGPTDDTAIRINDTLSIPRSEIEYRATRSGGPGGQHVNTSSTRIELTWNVATSTPLTNDERTRLLVKLATRIDGSGVLRLVSAGSRSQLQNKEEVTERFAGVIERALRIPKPRKRTKVPKGVKEDRLREKKKRSEVKRGRDKIGPYE